MNRRWRGIHDESEPSFLPQRKHMFQEKEDEDERCRQIPEKGLIPGISGLNPSKMRASTSTQDRTDWPPGHDQHQTER